jgi:hypothetical protein
MTNQIQIEASPIFQKNYAPLPKNIVIFASVVINLIANGLQTNEIIEDYPYLEPEDIQQSLRYAAWLTQERVIFWQTAQAV